MFGPAGMWPRIAGIFFTNKGCNDWDKCNNTFPDEWARCYLWAVVMPAVDQWRLKQQVRISPDERLACLGGGGIFCWDEHLPQCLPNSLWLQQCWKHDKSSFKSKFMTVKTAADLRGSVLHGVQTLEKTTWLMLMKLEEKMEFRIINKNINLTTPRWQTCVNLNVISKVLTLSCHFPVNERQRRTVLWMNDSTITGDIKLSSSYPLSFTLPQSFVW